MTTLTFPDVGSPAQLRWRLISNTQVVQSPLSGSVQSSELPGARWGFTATWPPLDDTSDLARRRAVMRAFLAQLSGQAGRFTVWPWERPTPQGSIALAAGSPQGVTVLGASQVGRSLITQGWLASATGLLLPGDYFGVNGELKMVTASAAANGAGQSTLQFTPPLRASPAANAVVTLIRPLATFMLTGGTVEWAIDVGNLFADFSIDAVEAF